MDPKSQSTTKTTTQKVNTIQETSAYSMFKFLPHNRPVVQNHVIRLAQSMKERPHLRPARPVLINEHREVIDGQHRLRGSELNGQTVFFMVVPGLTIDDARVLNALQRTWSLLDYAYSYASSRVPAYIQFVKNYEDRELPPSVIMEYMFVGGIRRRHQFRLGQMEPTDQKELDTRLDQLEEVLAVFPKAAQQYVIGSTFLTMLKTPGYDHARLMKQIGDSKLQTEADRASYLRELERVYNTNIPLGGPSYLRFF